MRKPIKLLLIFILLLSGCSPKPSHEALKLDLYYTTSCPYCHQMKESLFKKIKKEYPEVEIILHDVDDFEEELNYYDICGKYDLESKSFITPTKLLNFDGSIFESYEQEVLYPMLVVNEAYVFFGYDSKYDDLYIDDIKHYFKGEPLSDGVTSTHRYFIRQK